MKIRKTTQYPDKTVQEILAPESVPADVTQRFNVFPRLLKITFTFVWATVTYEEIT